MLCITVFHYFREKVDENAMQKMREIFSAPSTERFMQEIKSGKLPSVVMKDFNKDMFRIGGPRRRLHSLLLLFPIAGCLLIISALLASLSLIDNELIYRFGTMLEYGADSVLVISIVIVIYCAIQITKLARELA